MRILMLTRFYHNGQSTHVFSLCEELKKQQQSPCLNASQLGNPMYLHSLRQHRIPVTTTERLTALLLFAKRNRIEIVHTHSAHSLPFALEIGRKLSVPVVATCHYLEFEPIVQLKKAQKIITISQEMQSAYGFPEGKSTVIENGVDLTVFKPNKKQRDRRLAVLLTRMTLKKEPGFLAVTQALSNLNWEVVSLGNWNPKITPLSVRGWKSQIHSHINEADLVIGTGRAIREAMAAGCGAFVLGDWSDGLVTPENVTLLRHHNFSGRANKQTPNRDELESILSALTPHRLSCLQAFGHRYASDHFNLATTTKKTLDVYTLLVDESS